MGSNSVDIDATILDLNHMLDEMFAAGECLEDSDFSQCSVS